MIPTAHQKFIDSALSHFQRDDRILGVAAAGSYDSKMDEYSDLDLVVVVRDNDYPAMVVAGREIAESLGHLLTSFPGDHVGLPNLWICLFENPLLHVDLKIVSEDAFVHRSDDPKILWERGGELSKAMTKVAATPDTVDLQWIEDRFWTWVHYGALKIGRGEFFEVINFLAFLRASVLGPLLLQKCGQPPHGLRRVEEVCPDSIPALRTTLASTDDPVSCEEAIMATAKLYVELRELLATPALQRHRRAEMAAMQFLHEACDAAKAKNVLQFRQA